jgi:hypothetical protein
MLIRNVGIYLRVDAIQKNIVIFSAVTTSNLKSFEVCENYLPPLVTLWMSQLKRGGRGDCIARN